MTEQTPTMGQGEALSEPMMTISELKELIDEMGGLAIDLAILIQYWPDMASSAGWHRIEGCESERVAGRAAWIIHRQQEALASDLRAGLNRAYGAIQRQIIMFES
jgi:hypothetical protein